MILADKIIQLRKKSGWSQEELAEQLGVTRQSVSKWEGTQSVPDLNKLLAMSKLFGVSMDYLVKDEIETEEPILFPEATPSTPVRRVTMAEANEFLVLRRRASTRIALGVVLCMLSPVPLLLLAGMAEAGPLGMEKLAAGLGVGILLVMVAIAVAIFITVGMKSQPYEFLETEPIETEYGILGMVKEQKKQYADVYTLKNVLGACFCILSVIPLIVAIFIDYEPYTILGVCALLILAAAGVYQFITAGVIQESFNKLLQEGDYAPDAKRVNKNIGSVYWPIVTALYLGYSFITGDWTHSWIVWPVAGVLWAGIASIAKRKP